MKDRNRRELGAMRRIVQHKEEPTVVPANPAAEAEYTAIENAITQAEAQDLNFESGKGTVSGAVDQRLVAVYDLLSLMRSLSKASKVLDAATHPDVATKMRMGAIGNLQELLTRAHVFHTTLEPIKAAFIALGASATVAEDLQAKITAVESMRTLKLTGLDQQIGGTAGVTATVRAGMKRVRKLDAILCQIYRTNAVALAQWKAACRVERAPVTKREPTAAPAPEGAGSGI
jgi:hypothetical protein